MREVLFLFILMIASLSDYKKREVSNVLIVLSLFLGVILNIHFNTYIYIYFSLILLVFFVFLPINELGGGDKKLLSLVPMFVLNYTSLFYFILCFFYIFIYYYYKINYKAKKSIIFAPVILFCYTITLIMKEVII